ncbi:tautomerase family protein [Streptomyces sp. NPDC044780]|uniref:Tautomerase family protein n=1 Tax=Streptomyces luomodiensis TaxID=3026192 RepID=A0ABY9UUV3_9ACTN|nr:MULTISPECIES: tautomerase family protein [unclassified Streptomyces]WAP55147.1 tautomerase family protein [Streptomyces sp. S465]WNE95655.1 tautomerase family protein [Streptomyces sp. SCA4-21]
MPVVTVDWWQGNDRERRAVLVSELAATVSRVAGCPVEAVTVVVRDCEPGHHHDSASRPCSPDAGLGLMGPL